MLLDGVQRVGDARHASHGLQTQVTNIRLTHADEAAQQGDSLALQLLIADDRKRRDPKSTGWQGKSWKNNWKANIEK